MLRLVSNLFYFAALCLAAVGLLFHKDQVRGWRSLVILLVVGWTAFHMTVFAEGRFHYPLAPLLALCAGSGIAVLLDAQSREKAMVRLMQLAGQRA
jgi:hypothetical protein